MISPPLDLMAVAQANVTELAIGFYQIMHGEIQALQKKKKKWHLAGSPSYLSSDAKVVLRDQHGQSFRKQN